MEIYRWFQWIFSKKMIGTVFEDDYKEEHLQNTVDNMNLLYVAFTRAGKNLFITGKKASKSTFTKLQMVIQPQIELTNYSISYW